MMKRLVKGSKAAKDFMAKLRAKKGAVKKTVKRVVKNAKQSFKDGYSAKDKVGAVTSYAVIQYIKKYNDKFIIDVVPIKKYNLRKNTDYRDTRLLNISDTKTEANKEAERLYKFVNQIGSTLLINKGENPRKKPTRIIQVDRTKKGTFKKFKTISGVKKHTDTKSHNVNIDIVSGVGRKTGFIGRVIIKKYTLSELKKLNPIYFDKGNDRFFGVYKRKLMLSTKLNSQVMIEAQKNVFNGETLRTYSVRIIMPNGKLDTPRKFETLFGAADYIGKNIIL